jgi:hypothetical protein
MNIHTLYVSAGLLLIFSTSIQANTINVPGDSTTIQAGINGAVDDDTVMVAPGTYHEQDIDFGGKAILVTSHFPEDSAWVASVIVNADSLGRVIHFHSREDSNSVLKGLTITGGAVGSGGGAGILCDDSSPRIEYCIISGNTAVSAGGGIRCYLRSPKIRNCIITENVVIEGIGAGLDCFDSSPSIINCKFSDNWHLDGDGGGLFCWLSYPVIKNCIFQGDSAWIGGGMFLQESSPILINCEIRQNEAAVSYGGGVYSIESSPTFINCTIAENTSLARGGGLYLRDSTPSLFNCVIVRNTANEGGGIRCINSPLTLRNCLVSGNTANSGGALELKNSAHSITNCTISENTALQEGGGIYNEDAPSIITNTILWNNSPEEIYVFGSDSLTITYSDIQGGWEGEGNLDIDPLFRDPSFNNFHLMDVTCGDSLNSPCIDAGTPAIIDSILNCDWGLGTELSDLGTYGGSKSIVGIHDENTERQLPRHFSLNQNYPNPFNPTTTISFDVSGNSHVKQHTILSIYDLRGRHVKLLINSELESGNHRVVWDGRNDRGEIVSSGIYFYTIKSGEHVDTRKMTVVR